MVHKTKCRSTKCRTPYDAALSFTTIYILARMYESAGRAIAVTTALATALALHKMLKVLVEVFKNLYPMNPRIDLVDTLPDLRKLV